MEDSMMARESIYDELRSHIESGKKPTAGHTTEEDVTGWMGTAPTPVRESIAHLQQAGFDVCVGHMGSVLTHYMLADMIDIFEIRGTLEGFACRLLCSRITDEQLRKLEKICETIYEGRSQGDYLAVRDRDMVFHEFIVDNCGNSRIREITSALKRQAKSYLYTYELAGGKMFSSMERKYGHDKIIEALRKRDADQCETMCILHLRETVDGLWAVLSRDYVIASPK